MPAPPLPSELSRFLDVPRRAVVGMVRPDGQPSTTATWYAWRDGRLLLSMVSTSPRVRNVRTNPRVSLTVLGDDWYDHVTLHGTVTELRDDSGLADLDMLAQRYWGTPYPNRELTCVSAIVEVSRWQAWGDPGKTTRPEQHGRAS